MRGRIFFLLIVAVPALALSVAATAQTLTITSPLDQAELSLTDTLYFYHDDHLETPIAMTNGAGTLVWRTEHTPFGGIYALTVSTITNNLRFAGQYFDGETGLAQNYFRDYKHNTGRYWEPDPIGLLAQQALYPYASANPVRTTDFRGLQGATSMKQTVFVCCASANIGSGAHYKKHCYIQVGRMKYELQPKKNYSAGYPQKVPAPINPNADCAATTGCDLKGCLNKAFDKYPSGAKYGVSKGDPNSNTFAAALARACHLNMPKSANNSDSPGWNSQPPR